MTSDVHVLTGAYALHALADTERRQVERHLAECPDCAREVDELSATAARLAQAVAEPPPDRLRQRVLAQVAATRQHPPPGTAATIRRESARRARWAIGVASAAAVVLAAAVTLGVAVARTGQQRDTAQAELARLQATYEVVARIAAAPDTRSGAGAGSRGGSAFVLASHSLDQAALLVSGLPAPPSGHAYQAWLITAGHPRSIGLVPGTASDEANPAEPSAPLVFTGLEGTGKIGLTIEPAGGSAQPTTTPVVLFDLPT